jgi:hypothetical protein
MKVRRKHDIAHAGIYRLRKPSFSIELDTKKGAEAPLVKIFSD